MGRLPAFTQTVPDDAKRFRSMSPEERLTLFFELCDLTDSIVNNRPQPGRLREPNLRSAEADALWRRLMATARRG